MGAVDQNQVQQMRDMLYNNKTVKEPPAKIATLNRKDNTIDITDEFLDIAVPPVVERAQKELLPTLEAAVELKTLERATETATKLQEGVDQALKSHNLAAEVVLNKVESDTAAAIQDLTKLAHQVRPIEVRTEHNTIAINGVQHSKFEQLLKIVGSRLPVFMVGPAGTGKTAGAEKCAAALGLDFYAMSVGSQTSKSDIFGYKDAQGNYHQTAFREAYEKGGVFLLDEADAGNANVLVGLNAALSNGYVFFPDHVIKMHDNFRMVATANTFGNGASRQYVGRNQLDAATLDRFVVLTWDIDQHIEEALAIGEAGPRWLKVVRAVRTQALDEMELRVVVSPRATLRGSTLLESSMEFLDVLDTALIANMPEAERELLRNTAIAVWEKGAPKVAAKRGRPANVKLEELKETFDAEADTK